MKTVACGFLVVLALIGIVGSRTPALGQEVTAGIVGTVTDSSGAPINGAVVTARDTERGTVWNSTTSSAGEYNLTRLPVGTYEVKVVAPGFETVIHPPFVLVLNQTARVDVALRVGKATETVEVTGETPILQTQSTEVSTLIDSNTEVSLPLASRDYLQLTLLAPGVTNVDPDGMRQPQSMTDSGRPYINGNREQANEYLVDGVLNSEDKNNEVGYTPGIDAIQEFNLITQNASAEFGNYQGGVVSVSTKSGTNRFHGDLFEFFRNDALDANIASAGWTAGVNDNINNSNPGFNAQGIELKPELRYNQFGGTIGGPIVKDKLFFFADYQGQRLVNAGQTGAQLLTAQARTGDFGQLCTDFGGAFNSSGICTGASAPPGVTTQLVYPTGPPNVPIPFNNLATAGLTEDPVAANIFGKTQYYPLPQANTLASNNYFYNSGNHLNNNQGDLKIDYAASQKDHISGRWSQMDLNQPTFTGCIFCNAGATEGSDEPVRNAVIDWTHSITSTLLNEARVGFNAVRYDSTITPTSLLGNISEQLGITGGNAEEPGLVQISVPGSNGGTASLGLQNLIQVFHDTQAQVEDNLIFTHGRHQLKVGFQYVRERQDYIYAGNDGALGLLSIGDATGSGLADFWLGNVAGGTGSPRDFGGQVSDPAKLRGNVFGVFAQDDWRITNNLTVNLGLRFEDHTPLAEIDNRAVNFGLYTGTIYTATGIDGTTKFHNQALYNNYTGIGDWLPRIGIAWSPAMWHGKTVIRAGFGISEFMEGGGSNEELNMNLPFGVLEQYAAGGLGTLANGFGGSTSAAACPQGIVFSCYAGNRIRVFDQNFRPAVVNQWNLTIQQQFSNSLTFQMGYVGQRGAHLLNFEDIAQSVPLDAAGKIAGAGDPIVTRVPGPFLGGGTPGSLYLADNPQFNAPNCGTAGNPACTGVETLAGANMSNSDQSYNALQAVLQKRMGNGLQGQVAYTWSKCMSNSPGYFGTGWGSTSAMSSGGQPGWQNDYNPRLNWGPCYYDQRNILTSYVTYALPFGHGKQFGHDMNPALNAVLGNWEIGAIVTLHSGNSLTFNNFGGWGVGGNSDNTNGIGPETLANLPDCNGSVKILNQRVPASGGTPAYIQYVDPASLSPAAPNTFGTCTPGNARGPAYENFDLSLHKDFLITESKRLEFRIEGLNAFNHPVWTFFGGPDNGTFDPGTYSLVNGVPVSSNSNFGKYSGAQGARELQFGLKFYF
jgi:hypothetical protein